MEILGQPRGLKFGTLAAEKILIDLAGQGIKPGSDYNQLNAATILYWGLWQCAQSKKELVDFSFEDVCDWVDEAWYDDSRAKEIARVIQEWEGSKHSILVIERMQKRLEELKKKTPTQSSPTGQTSRRKKAGRTSEASPSGSSAGPA